MDPASLDDSFSPRTADLGSEGLLTPPYVWRPRPKYQDRVWLHLLLFLLTVGTTWMVGGPDQSVAVSLIRQV